MKGYWYIPALAAIGSIFTKIFDSVVFIIVLLLWLFYLYRLKRLGKTPIIFSLATFLFLFLYIPQIEMDISLNSTSQNVNLLGKITSPINVSETILQFDFQENDTKNPIKVIYFNPDMNHPNFTTIQHGATCKLEGMVGLPEGSTNPGQFDYQQYLASSGIYYEMEIDSMENITCYGKANLSILFWVRENIKNYISNTYSEDTSAWINALVLGDDALISEETTELFQRWGLSHLLAISGLHIGLVVGLLYFITVKLNLLTKEKAQYVMIIFLPIYAVLAGGEPSVLRASLMVLLVIFIQKLKIKFPATDIISVAFLTLVIMDKYIVYHIGFQLSFIVSFGIILSRKWLMESESVFFQMLKLSFISQLMIVPLQIIYFYNFNPLSIILNVLVVPYFSFFVIPLMFIFIILSLIPIVHMIVDKIFVVLHESLFLSPLHVLDQYAYYPWLTGQFPTVLIVFYYVLLIVMMGFIQRDKNCKAFISGVMLTGLLFSLIIRPYLSPQGTVTMLDIGQGDAIVIEFPYRKGTVIVDAGANFSYEDFEPSDSNYRRILKPFLQYQGINKIEAVFITHEDIDHVGSISYIFKDFDVQELIISEFFDFDEGLLENLKQKGVGISRVEAGQTLDIKGNMFTILSPWVDKNSSNENSLVFQINLGKLSWLFTGDIHQNIEREILHRFPNLEVDVLKIAHHGSDTSTDPIFINQLKPKFALISVGRENRYGHPSSDVLDRLLKENVSVLRTDQHGAIIYRYTEMNGTFYPFKP